MGNLPVSTSKVAESSLSWKEVKEKALTEARRIKSETIALAYNMTPQPMEIMKKSMDAVVSTATSLIESKFKQETGMTLAEAKYKLNDGIQLFKRYKEMGSSNAERVIDKKKKNNKSGDKTSLKEKKAKTKEKLIKWLEKQPDNLYNAFFLVQAKDVISEVKTVTAQMDAGGIDIIQETIDSLRNLQKFFPGGADYKKEKPKEDLTLTFENVEDDGSAKSMLSELSKSAKNTRGEDYIPSTDLSKKGLNVTSKTILSLISSLIALLVPFFTLIYNYNTNKNGLKADGDVHSDEMLRGNAERLGLTEEKPYETVSKTVDVSNTDTKKELRAEVESEKERLKEEAENTNSKVSKDTIEDNSDKSKNKKQNSVSEEIGDDIKDLISELASDGTQGTSIQSNNNLSEGDLNKLKSGTSLDVGQGGDLITGNGINGISNGVGQLQVSDGLGSGSNNKGNELNNSSDNSLNANGNSNSSDEENTENNVESSNGNSNEISNGNSDGNDGDYSSDSNLSSSESSDDNGKWSNNKKDDTKKAMDGSPLKNVENPNYDNIDNLSISGGMSATIDWNEEDTQNFDMDYMKFLNETEDLDEMSIDMPTIKGTEGKFVLSTPTSDVMYLPPTDGFSDEILFSEIDRVVYKLEEAKEICKFNPQYPLESTSTKTDGGKMNNLQHAGDNKKELIEAILTINNGVRL